MQLSNKTYNIPDLQIKKFEVPKGYITRRKTKRGVEIKLTQKAIELIKKRLGLGD